ncbi:hypothetical protein [Halococcus sediminicola]|uniref:hypothetical protein n=1 Tax=Halococcus sediminicola TaxID=1264579 RepID=UPI0009AC4449|nr:hypothetical protein [Halococcus sediminicola]
MTVPSVVVQMEVLAGTGTALVVLAVLAGFVYRWDVKSSSDDTEHEQEGAVGTPLASWRYVYDVEKADANREIAAVQQQAEELSEAERQSR